MKQIIMYMFTSVFTIFCFFQLGSATQLKINPFTIDANTEKIIEKYVVQKDDTLSEIGYKYNVSIQALSMYNNLRSQIIYIGQKLLIPLKPTNKGSIDNEKKEVVQEIIRQGNINRNQQQYEKAIELYRESLDFDQYNMDAYYGIGYSNLKMGLHNKAIESFIKAVKIDPYDPKSHYNLGLAYVLIKEKGPAFEQYKILKILNENYATRLLMYVDSLR